MDQSLQSRLWRLVLLYRTPLVVLLVIMLVIAIRQPAMPFQPPEPVPTTAEPTRMLVPKSVATATVAGGRAPVMRTEHLVLFTSNGAYTAEQITEAAPELEIALLYVQERTSMQLLRPVNIMFDRRPGVCGLDAVAYTQVRTIVLYICPETSQQRAINVLAHEFVHQLAHDNFGATHLQADLILSEGLATWGAGRYWLGDTQSFQSFVAVNYGSRLLPLVTAPRGDESAATLNQLYYQWAAFIEWIIEQQGTSTIERLYAAGNGRQTGSAPYATELDLPFTEVESHWQRWIEAEP